MFPLSNKRNEVIIKDRATPQTRQVSYIYRGGSGICERGVQTIGLKRGVVSRRGRCRDDVEEPKISSGLNGNGEDIWRSVVSSPSGAPSPESDRGVLGAVSSVAV